MTIFAVTYRYSDDVATRDTLRSEHRDHLRGLADHGLLLFRADDRAHVNTLVENDPSTPSGVIAEATTAEWDPVIGPLLAALHSDPAPSGRERA